LEEDLRGNSLEGGHRRDRKARKGVAEFSIYTFSPRRRSGRSGNAALAVTLYFLDQDLQD